MKIKGVTYDKYLTRLANRPGGSRVLMYGRWWDLEQGGYYRVDFNRTKPSESKVVRCG